MTAISEISDELRAEIEAGRLAHLAVMDFLDGHLAGLTALRDAAQDFLDDMKVTPGTPSPGETGGGDGHPPAVASFSSACIRRPLCAHPDGHGGRCRDVRGVDCGPWGPPTRLPLGEGTKPLQALVEGDLFQFPDGHAFHRFVRLDPPDAVSGLAELRYGVHGSLNVDVTELADPDIEVSWCSTDRADEMVADEFAAERARMAGAAAEDDLADRLHRDELLGGAA